MIKTEHTGIYHVSSDDNKKIHKFVIRQTVTISGFGKKTVKETFTKSGVSYKIALESARDERPLMRERAKKKIMGVTEDESKSNALQIITLDEVWEDYVKHKTVTSAKLWSDTATRTMKSTYKNHISPVIGKKRAIRVGYEDVEKCILKMRANGLSARMENGIISALRPMFTWWYIRKGLIDSRTNPATNQEARPSELRTVSLTWKQMEKLFKAMYNYHDERFRQVWIWVSTGRRINEVLSLTHDDIKDGYYTILSEKNKVRKPMMYKVPKGATLPKYEGWVHTSPRNRDKPLTQPTVDKQWVALRTLVGLHSFNKHDIRHLIETVLTDSDCPQRTINMVLGHIEAGASKHYKNSKLRQYSFSLIRFLTK